MAEFNKGYYRRQGRQEGAYNERERIIKLIEATANDSEHTQHYAEDCWCSGWASVIALIKGEN